MKTEIVRFRITPELKAKLQAAAAAENRTMSNFLENLIQKSFVKEKNEMKANVKLYRTNADVFIHRYDHWEDESQWQEDQALPSFSVYFEDLGYDLDNLRDYLAEQLDGIDNAESLIDDIVFKIDSDYWHREKENIDE